MNKSKLLLAFILILCVLQATFSEQRKKPQPLEEFTNPDSPSFIPCPYPKTREEIIVNLKYIIDKVYTIKENDHFVHLGPAFTSTKILPTLFHEKTDYKIGRIIKVKNLFSSYPYDFYWLTFILDKDNNVVVRIAFEENGIWAGTLCYPPDRKLSPLTTEDKILAGLSEKTGLPITKKDIKRMDAIALQPRISTIFVPAYEIELKKGDRYYYSTGKKEFFQVTRSLPWKKRKNGLRPDFFEMVNNKDYFAYDEVNDQLMVFEKLKKKE